MRLLRAAPAAALAGIALVLPAGALAHGDPASHTLESESLYLSFTAQPTRDVERQLRGYVAAAARNGAPLKVTLVGGVADVPENPSMLRHPQRFAEFARRRLENNSLHRSSVPILVVTPSGVGVSGPMTIGDTFGPVTRPAARSLLGGIPAPGTLGDDLAGAAMTAIRRIAHAAGRPLPANVPPAEIPAPPRWDPYADERISDGASPWQAVAVFAAIFGTAAAAYEALARAARRRRPAALRPGPTPASGPDGDR